MQYHPTAAALADDRQTTESPENTSTTSKTVLHVTPMLQTICRSIFLSTFGRAAESERTYVQDVARGRYQTVDFDRLALLARRSMRPANRIALVNYVRELASEQRAVMPIDRALLRKVVEEGEANSAVERFRFQRCVPSVEAAIAEIDDLSAALDDLKESLRAEREKLVAGATA